MTTIPPLRPEPPRDQYGRYLIEGRPWTRATTVVGTLKDLNGLIAWKRRKVLEGAALNPILLNRVPELTAAIEAAGDDWKAAKEAKAALDEVCDEAADAAGANQGSTNGTDAHTLTEWADAGRLDEVQQHATDAQLADLQAYLDTMNAHGIARPAEYIERVVVNFVTGSAGTFDRLVYLPDGRLVVADLKSQQNVDFGFLEMCCQLAQYANADFMVGDDGQLTPMPTDVDKTTGLVMHAPVGAARCDLYLIDLATGWEAAQLACRVRQLRAESKQLGVPYTAQPAPVADRVLRLIADAQHPTALEALWRDLAPQGQWTDRHTEAARRRKAELVTTN